MADEALLQMCFLHFLIVTHCANDLTSSPLRNLQNGNNLYYAGLHEIINLAWTYCQAHSTIPPHCLVERWRIKLQITIFHFTVNSMSPKLLLLLLTVKYSELKLQSSNFSLFFKERWEQGHWRPLKANAVKEGWDPNVYSENHPLTMIIFLWPIRS